MSDFLTRLVARTLGSSPAIQPRVPSRFEHGLGVFEEHEAEPVLGHERAPSAAVARPHASAAPQPESPDFEVRRRGPQDQRVPHIVTQVDLRPRQAERSVEKPPVRTLEVAAEGVTTPQEMMNLSRPQQLYPADGAAEVAAPPAQPAVTIVAEAAQPDGRRDAPSPTEKAENVSPQPTIEAPVRTVTRLVRAEATPIAAAERFTPAPARTPPSPAPAPDINITIGRIEVRAVQPAPAQQPKPAPGPSLTLDAYLRSFPRGRS